MLVSLDTLSRDDFFLKRQNCKSGGHILFILIPPAPAPAAAAAAAKSLQSCPTLCDPIDGSPPGSPVPGILHSPGKNTGVGCHFLLQCMKVKSESEVAQSCLTLSDPMDCSPPGSSVHGIFQAAAPVHNEYFVNDMTNMI